MAAGAPLIRLQGVVKQYGQQQVLRGIDLEPEVMLFGGDWRDVL